MLYQLVLNGCKTFRKYLVPMENTLSIYVESVNENWEMGDDMALKLEEYKKEHEAAITDADDLHLGWYKTLTPQEQERIQKSTLEA